MKLRGTLTQFPLFGKKSERHYEVWTEYRQHRRIAIVFWESRKQKGLDLLMRALTVFVRESRIVSVGSLARRRDPVEKLFCKKKMGDEILVSPNKAGSG